MKAALATSEINYSYISVSWANTLVTVFDYDVINSRPLSSMFKHFKHLNDISSKRFFVHHLFLFFLDRRDGYFILFYLLLFLLLFSPACHNFGMPIKLLSKQIENRIVESLNISEKELKKITSVLGNLSSNKQLIVSCKKDIKVSENILYIF